MEFEGLISVLIGELVEFIFAICFKVMSLRVLVLLSCATTLSLDPLKPK